MKERVRSPKFWLCIALVLCLISMIGVSLLQTSNNNIIIKQMTWESPSGHQLSADLYRPKTATADNPAPAIVTIEGWYNNKEMQDLYTTELARRGYVVLTLDMHGHGDSECLASAELYDGAVGVDGAVQLIASLPYVDASRIGVTGHSSGGTAANMAVAIDNERDVPLIKSVLQQAGDWQDDTGADHSGDYGSRSVGIIASKHDDFYFGTYDENGNMLTSAAEFLETDGAKKFLNFNEEPTDFGQAEAGKYYTKDFDGETSYRVIYRPNMIHPLVTFSTECVGYAVDFFETTIGAPNPIPSTSQTWPAKTALNVVGLIGFIMFFVSFMLSMLDTKFFGELKAEKLAEPLEVPDGKGKAWFWVTSILAMLFSGFSYILCMNNIYPTTTEFFPQTAPLTIGIWSAVCGVFSIILMVVTYLCYSKKNGFSLAERGVTMSFLKIWKSLLLAIITIVVTYSIVFFADYFFQTDFRLWTFAFKTFGAQKVIFALKYVIFFLLFYVVNSISINCFNFNKIGRKGNVVLMGLINCFAAIVIVAYQYITFYAAGYQPLGLTEGQRMMPIWLFPIIIILFGAALISRTIYKRTRNPYIAGCANAFIITVMFCSNTFTMMGAGALICTTF